MTNIPGRVGRHAKDEPSQVRQGGRYGQPDLPQRGFSPLQHQRQILLWPYLCKYYIIFLGANILLLLYSLSNRHNCLFAHNLLS